MNAWRIVLFRKLAFDLCARRCRADTRSPAKNRLTIADE